MLQKFTVAIYKITIVKSWVYLNNMSLTPSGLPKKQLNSVF